MSPLHAPANAGIKTGSARVIGLVMALFFAFGFCTVLVDSIIPKLKATFALSYAEVMLTQFCFFGAYFLVSLPAAWLHSRNAKFSLISTMSALTQPAEQLPLSFLPRLARMKPGEIAAFATPLGASVVQLVHYEEAPLSEQQAAPLIEQFLAGRKRLETAAAEVKRLREVATIEYVGEFKRSN